MSICRWLGEWECVIMNGGKNGHINNHIWQLLSSFSSYYNGWIRSDRWEDGWRESPHPLLRNCTSPSNWMFSVVLMQALTWMGLCLISLKLLHCISLQCSRWVNINWKYYLLSWHFSWQCRYCWSSNKIMWHVCTHKVKYKPLITEVFCTSVTLGMQLHLQDISYVSLLPWTWLHLLTACDTHQTYVESQSGMWAQAHWRNINQKRWVCSWSSAYRSRCSEVRTEMGLLHNDRLERFHSLSGRQ